MRIWLHCDQTDTEITNHQGGESGPLFTMFNKPDAKFFKEVSIGGRFEKYGDAKRKAKIPKSRLRPAVPWPAAKDKPVKGSNRSSEAGRVHRKSSSGQTRNPEAVEGI